MPPPAAFFWPHHPPGQIVAPHDHAHVAPAWFEVETDSTFTYGAQRVLFSTTGYRTVQAHQGYVVMPDDKHFIMIRMGGSEDVGELLVVENWFDELESLAGRGDEGSQTSAR